MTKASKDSLDAINVVPELILARLVPEEAGDPFTDDGKKNIEKHYYLATLDVRLERTFDSLMTLSDYPGDFQTLSVDYSSVWDHNYARFLHHQATNFDKLGVSMFAGFHALGVKHPDTTIEPGRELAVYREAEWEDKGKKMLRVEWGNGAAGITKMMHVGGATVIDVDVENDKVTVDDADLLPKNAAILVFTPPHADVRRRWREVVEWDVNSVWRVGKASGLRMGDMLGVHWPECNASHEWKNPVAMEDKRRLVYLSRPGLSRSNKSYSHQKLAFTLARKKKHVSGGPGATIAPRVRSQTTNTPPPISTRTVPHHLFSALFLPHLCRGRCLRRASHGPHHAPCRAGLLFHRPPLAPLRFGPLPAPHQLLHHD